MQYVVYSMSARYLCQAQNTVSCISARFYLYVPPDLDWRFFVRHPKTEQKPNGGGGRALGRHAWPRGVLPKNVGAFLTSVLQVGEQYAVFAVYFAL